MEVTLLPGHRPAADPAAPPRPAELAAAVRAADRQPARRLGPGSTPRRSRSGGPAEPQTCRAAAPGRSTDRRPADPPAAACSSSPSRPTAVHRPGARPRRGGADHRRRPARCCSRVGGHWLIGRGLAPLDRDGEHRPPDHHPGRPDRADARRRTTDRGGQAGRGRSTPCWTGSSRRSAPGCVRSRRSAQFAADASHELRTPLTTIRGLRRAVPAGRARPRSAAGRDAPDRAGGAAHEHAGRRAAGTGPAGPHLLAGPDRDRPGRAWCATPWPTPVAVEPDRPVEAETPARLIAVVDEARIRQVLANLLGNVREHTPARTPVAVRLAQVRGGVVLEVADAGPGHVSAGRRPRIRPVPPRRGPGRAGAAGGDGRHPVAAAGSACPSCRPSPSPTAARPPWSPGPAGVPGSGSGCRASPTLSADQLGGRLLSRAGQVLEQVVDGEQPEDDQCRQREAKRRDQGPSDVRGPADGEPRYRLPQRLARQRRLPAGWHGSPRTPRCRRTRRISRS